MTVTLSIESPDRPDVVALVAALDAYQDRLYPPASRHVLDLTGLMAPHVRMVVARDVTGAALGCGALVQHPDYGELKRLYVLPAARGQGIAKAIVARLTDLAIALGCSLLRLETGPLQPEALGLYARLGFQRCGAFGGYRPAPLSVFLHKHICPST